MKLLLDENLSPRIAGRLADLFPDSRHVPELGLVGQSDSAIWNHAAIHGFVIVSKDDDFRSLSFLRGAPPKVVWLRLGNCTTHQIESLLRGRHADIMSFASQSEASLLLLP